MHGFICLEVCSVHSQDRLIVYLIDLSAAGLFWAMSPFANLGRLAAVTQGSHMIVFESIRI